MDNEGFRIPRRFVARDAVDDELERLEKAIAAASAEISGHREADLPRNWARSTPPSSRPICKCSRMPACGANWRT